MENSINESLDSEIVSEEELATQLAQYKRIAMRILKLIIQSMPGIAPQLKIKGKDIKVNNEVKMPLLGDYEGSILPSYIIVKGDKDRTLYFCIMNERLFNAIKDILIKNIQLREALTQHTVKIQFACPDIGYGLYFLKKSKGLFKGKKTHVYQFTLSDHDNL